MIRYCAFLRGVNVKGTNMKMQDVCKVFEQVNSVQQVSSVLASGNILFQSSQTTSELKSELEQAMSKHFNYDAFLFLKTENEILDIFNSNPFSANPDVHNYVFVGEEGVEQLLLEEFEKASQINEIEDAKIVKQTFYWKVPKNETLTSNFGKIIGNKKFKNKMTSRNINTFGKIINQLKK